MGTNRMSRDIRDIQEKKPRERRTLRQLWALLKQNLKDWDWYRKEHPDRFTLDIQSGVKHLAQVVIGMWKIFVWHGVCLNYLLQNSS